MQPERDSQTRRSARRAQATPNPYARNGAAPYAAKRPKPTLVPIVVGVAAVIVVAVGIFALMGGASGGASSDQAAASDSSAAAQQTVTDVSDSKASSSEASGESEPSAELSERDQEFALDPSRTDWSFADNGRKVVYLTIDDGPSELTPQVLDILDKYDCKATFFVVGHDPQYYHLIKEAYDKGHTIGLHTMTHDYAQVYASQKAYFDDLDQIGQVVKDQIGYVPCFIRFPGGSSNAISSNYSPGIMTALVDAVQEKGYQYYDWNISTGDGSDHTADELFSYATEGNPPGQFDTNIVMLCHDSATKQTTVDALPRIIEYYQGMGYSFEPIDRSTWVCHHGIGG